MKNKASLLSVIIYSIIIILFGELTKYGGYFIFISFILNLGFLTFFKKINVLEIFSTLLIVAAFGQILRGANGYVCYVSLIFMIVLFLRDKKFKFSFSKFFSFILISQIISLFYYNEYSVFSTLGGLISLFGVFSATIFINNISWNQSSLLFVFKAICVIPFFSILITICDASSLNTSLFLLSNNVMTENDFFGLNKYGSFGSSELMAEFMMFCSIISFNLMNFSFNTQNKLFFRISFIISIILIILAFSRSIVVLTSILLLITLIVTKGTYKNLGIIIISTGLIASLNLNQSSFLEKFKSNTEITSSIFSNPFTAENTSRESVFAIALEKINSKPYILGEGYKLSIDNSKIWLGNLYESYADYHNLYYSIIPLFGWIVLLAFLFVLFKMLRKCFLNLLYTKKKDFEYRVYFIFFLVLIAFILGEWKINALRTGAYFYLVSSILFVIYKILFNNSSNYKYEH